jgi:hypothetical protein
MKHKNKKELLSGLNQYFAYTGNYSSSYFTNYQLNGTIFLLHAY